MNVMAPAIIFVYFRRQLKSKLRFVSTITHKNVKAYTHIHNTKTNVIVLQADDESAAL